MPAPPDATLDALRQAQRLHAAGRLAEAEAGYRAVLAADPDNPHALHLSGVLALQRGDLQQAHELIGRALQVRPAFPEALGNLGVVLEHLDRLAEAERAYREAIRLQPNYLDAHNNLGNALRKQGQFAEAAAAYRAAARLRPEHPAAYLGLALAAHERADPDAAVAHYRRWSALQPDNPSAASDLLFALLHHPGLTAEQLFAEHRRWSEAFERPLRATWLPHANDRDPDRPLRVGYVSPDFREHATARFMEPVLASHDRGRFTVVCYSDARRPDAATARFRSYAAEWRDTAGVPDEHLAAQIRRDGIDVLVDPTGHMAGNRLGVFARRPAPVQAAYMSYPHSTGLESMGWRVTDAASEPPELGGERFNTERLLRLDGCAFCYRPTEAPDVSDLPALSDGGRVTFGMLNRMAKVNPPAIRLWARVLAAVPGSTLLVLASGGERNDAVRQVFESEGIKPDRLRLVPTGSRQQYLSLAHQIDVNLDPFPYAGMTTTCDLLWMGVPTVTLAQGGSAGRAGASLLTAAGLPQLIAHTPDEYVRIAAALAGDLPALAALRAGLRRQVERSPFRDERGTAARLEAAYRHMWRAWCERHRAGAGSQ